MLTTLCWCVCKILLKWMSINFCFSSWSHCKCHMQSTQGVDLPDDVPVLALERGCHRQASESGSSAEVPSALQPGPNLHRQGLGAMLAWSSSL